jgi:hypothetical protein
MPENILTDAHQIECKARDRNQVINLKLCFTGVAFMLRFFNYKTR